MAKLNRKSKREYTEIMSMLVDTLYRARDMIKTGACGDLEHIGIAADYAKLTVASHADIVCNTLALELCKTLGRDGNKLAKKFAS